MNACMRAYVSVYVTQGMFPSRPPIAVYGYDKGLVLGFFRVSLGLG